MRRAKLLVMSTAVLCLVAGNLAAQRDPKSGYPTKWSQWVDMDNGHGIVSHFDVSLGIGPTIAEAAADDWRCLDGRPVTDFHWWGSYDLGGPGDLDSFLFVIQADIPADDLHPSHPGTVLWSTMRNFTKVEEVLFGTHADGTDIYQYNMVLDDSQDWFYQQRDEIYWLSVVGVASEPDNEVVWAWRTAQRPTPDNGLDAAVRMMDYNYTTGEYAYWGSLYDEGCNIQMAFELSTIPEPGSMALAGTSVLVLTGLRIRRRMR